ncbi:hypothetical protein [Pleomorphomonas koreensis]|uniref:hypothetical protein n=1 Tax=Pleomorphomonas koreensis TaxID=257440 RepID=UPI000417B63B|nr:hypothetical protein [Pleomorphomonas koreensis]
MNVLASKRQAMSLEQLLENGWDGFEQLERLNLSPPKDGYRPSDKVARVAHALTLNPDTLEFLDWLMDITLRAPLRVPDAGIEQVALAYATRRGINGVGEAVLAAIEMGRKLQEENHAHDRQTSE